MSESPQTDLPGPGGFLPSRNPLPSPAPSTASSRVAALLPHPRSRPLAPGSRKEDYARDYVARRLLHISRRYVKKFGIPDPADQVSGYESMEEVCRDLEEVVDVLWFSGTRKLCSPLSPQCTPVLICSPRSIRCSQPPGTLSSQHSSCIQHLPPVLPAGATTDIRAPPKARPLLRQPARRVRC